MHLLFVSMLVALSLCSLDVETLKYLTSKYKWVSLSGWPIKWTIRENLTVSQFQVSKRLLRLS